jgi:type III secretion protein T
MVSRFAPQVQVFILAMPIKSLLAIFMLVFYVEILFPFANRQVYSGIAFASRFYQVIDASRAASPTGPPNDRGFVR